MQGKYKSKTIKRKIASLRAFFLYLESENIEIEKFFLNIRTKFKDSVILPRTIKLEDISKIFNEVYKQLKNDRNTIYAKKSILRDIAILELLFATGLRVSEICSLRNKYIDILHGEILVLGKGAKERIIQVTNINTIESLENYFDIFKSSKDLNKDAYYFINRRGQRLSEQSVRFMVKKYSNMCGIKDNITPHMFRHTFATMLLEDDVDIRYIQRILGHSSIITTQIYTNVAVSKQKEILTIKQPRNKIVL